MRRKLYQLFPAPWDEIVWRAMVSMAFIGVLSFLVILISFAI